MSNETIKREAVKQFIMNIQQEIANLMDDNGHLVSLDREVSKREYTHLLYHNLERMTLLLDSLDNLYDML